MSYKTDLAFPKQEPSRESFLQYLKQQHQHSLQTAQSLEHKVQILEKSILHLQARIKLKDSQLQQQSQLLTTKDIQLEQLRNNNNQLLLKSKVLKKQNAKVQIQFRQLQQQLEGERLVMKNLQNERAYLLQRAEEREPEVSTEVDYLRARNLELEKQLLRFREGNNSERYREELNRKNLQIEELHNFLGKISDELHTKTSLYEQLKTQHEILQKVNATLRSQLQQYLEPTDPSSRRKSTKVSLPSHNKEYNTHSSNLNKSMEVTQQRRAGGIRSRNVNQESLIFQGDLNAISIVRQTPKEKGKVETVESANKGKQEEEIRRQSLLQDLVTRFQRLKKQSLTNVMV